MLKYSVQFSFMAFLLISLVGCQTGEVTRTPAGGSLEPTTLKALKEDGAQVLGKVAYEILLEKKLLALQKQKTLILPNHLTVKFPKIEGISMLDSLQQESGKWSGGTLFVASVLVGQGILGFSGGEILYSYGKSKGLTARPFFQFVRFAADFDDRPLTGSLKMAGSGFSMSAVAGGVYTSVKSSAPIAENHGKNNPVESFQLVFRRNDVRKYETEIAESENATSQAAFTADLKATAATLASSIATLLHYSPAEAAILRDTLEDKILDRFHSKESWKIGETFQVNIQPILATIQRESEERMRNIDTLFYAADEKSTVRIETTGDAMKWYEKTLGDLDGLNKHILEIYATLRDHVDVDVKALAKSFLASSLEIEDLQKRMTLHATVLRAKR